MEEKRFCLLLFGQNRYSCIGYSTTETFTIDGFYSCFYTFITHNIGILSHGTQQISVIDQTQDSIRLIKAYTDYVILTGSLDGVTGAGGGTFVTSEDTYNALGNIVLCNTLGFCCIAFAVLSLQKFEISSFKCRTETW